MSKSMHKGTQMHKMKKELCTKTKCLRDGFMFLFNHYIIESIQSSSIESVTGSCSCSIINK